MDIDFSTVKRNDPCPCGSGKKFKKCHYRTEALRQQAEAQQVDLSSFIRKGQIPYLWQKGLRTIINRRDWALLYEVFLPESPITQTWPDKAAFVEAARTSPSAVPAGGDSDLRRMRLLGNKAFVMFARGLEDRRVEEATYEVLALQNTDEGYRITQVETMAVAKTEGMEDPEFETFACVKAAYDEVLAAPVVRPTIKRWPIDGTAPPAPDFDDIGDDDDDFDGDFGDDEADEADAAAMEADEAPEAEAAE